MKKPRDIIKIPGLNLNAKHKNGKQVYTLKDATNPYK